MKMKKLSKEEIEIRVEDAYINFDKETKLANLYDDESANFFMFNAEFGKKFNGKRLWCNCGFSGDFNRSLYDDETIEIMEQALLKKLKKRAEALKVALVAIEDCFDESIFLEEIAGTINIRIGLEDQPIVRLCRYLSDWKRFEVFYRVPFPGREGWTVEVYGDKEEKWYEYRVMCRGTIVDDTFVQFKNAEIALRDALVSVTGEGRKNDTEWCKT
jgi:hypothetical protein